jgi:uncharacterized repeat protein (TIGR01451 family)
VTLTDALMAQTPPAIATLVPNETKVYTYSYVVTESDIRNYRVTNTAKAEGMFGTRKVSDSAWKTVFTDWPNPSLNVTKVVTNTPADGVAYALNEVIEYKLTVKNDGNVTLTNVVVTDALMTPSPTTIPSLAPGATMEYTYTHTVTEADNVRDTRTIRRRPRRFKWKGDQGL